MVIIFALMSKNYILEATKFEIILLLMVCYLKVNIYIQIIQMKICQGQMEGSAATQKKNTFQLIYHNTAIKVSGNFESGNLNWAGVNQQNDQIQLHFGKDKDIKSSSKCWFYFSISGNYNYLPIKLYLQRTNSLTIASKVYDLYRPVVRVEGGDWDRHKFPVNFQMTPEGDVGFRMELQLYGNRKFEVALCYPWTLTDNEEYLYDLERSLAKRTDIYYNRQTLIYSPKKNPIHLIAISSGQVRQNEQQGYMQHLFPCRSQQSHYKAIKKPLIMITSRVHPSETGSSYSLLGMIDYLTSGNVEARKMLSEFYFLIIPILNPDGVAAGNSRMDALGQNLNRFYLMPDLQKQPSCFAVKSLLMQSTKTKQLYAFFDLHGHQNKKSCFLFGNSINSQRLQIQSILFAKYFSSICDYMQFKSCNFSKKQMSSKDKNQDLSKQGCARVVVHRWTDSPYCYTLQTGIFKNVKVDDKGIQRYGQQFYNPRIYAQVGEKMLISLFSILKKDKQIDQMRKQVAIYASKLQKISQKKQLKSVQDKKRKKQKNTSSQALQKIENRTQSVSATDIIKKIGGFNQKQNEKYKNYDQISKKTKKNLLSQDDDDQY